MYHTNPWRHPSSGIQRGQGVGVLRGHPMATLWLLLCLLLTVGCSTGQMDEQARCDPLEPSSFFEDGRCSRYLPENSVARGQMTDDALLYEGREEGETADESGAGEAGEGEEATVQEGDATTQPGSQPQYAATYPFPITQEVMERGQERYDIYCMPCHGGVGLGNGMVVRRGYPAPPSLHIDRLREAPPGYLYDVIANGIGIMPDYDDQIEVADRWAIVAYVQALQLSQNATIDNVPEEARGQLGQSE